jgi:DNA-binding GntR family transcriptional regulator
VREAFRRLEAQGLLLTDTHRGTTIAGGDFGATEANYRIRAALEGLAAQFAAEAISEEEIDEIDGLNEELAGGPQAIRPAEESIRDHRALIDALRRHDADAAAEITRRHILGAIPYLNP